MIREVAKRGVNVTPLSDANLASLHYENEQTPDGPEQLRELGTVMVECLNELEEDERDVLLLWVLTELTYKQIAARLNLPAGTVATRCSAAREKMRRSLRRLDEDIAG